jgi:hypothetical protein
LQTKVRGKSDVMVKYDDGYVQMENLAKVKHTMVAYDAAYDRYLGTPQLVAACRAVLGAIERFGVSTFAVHSKGMGVVSNVPLSAGKMLGVYWGHLYPAWLWEQKEAAEDELREKEKRKGRMALPDFWNIRLEIPKDDEGGFDLMHVESKHCGTFTSRMSHSCRPNCGAITAVIDGKVRARGGGGCVHGVAADVPLGAPQFCVAMRALHKIEAGDELTIDYNCITDSMEEFKAAICLCGSHDCRGCVWPLPASRALTRAATTRRSSFLYISGDKNQNYVSDKYQTGLHRVGMLLRASFACGEIERALGLGFTSSWPRWIEKGNKSPAKKREDGDAAVGEERRLGEFGVGSKVRCCLGGSCGRRG